MHIEPDREGTGHVKSPRSSSIIEKMTTEYPPLLFFF